MMTTGYVIERNTQKRLSSKFREMCEVFTRFEKWEGDYLDIPLDLLYERTKAFRRHLRANRIKEWDSKKFSDFLPRLFSEARKLGWEPDQDVPIPWQKILAEAQRRKCQDIARYFMRYHAEPGTVTHVQVEQWVDNTVINGDRTFITAYRCSRVFESTLIAQGYPSVNPTRAARMVKYGAKLEDFTEPLQSQVRALLAFRVEPISTWHRSESADNGMFSESEDDDCEDDDEPLLTRRRHVRESTAYDDKKIICRLYGFMKSKRPKREVGSLSELFSRRAFREYKSYLLEVRVASPRAVLNTFATLIGMARQYQPIANKLWYTGFFRDLDREAASEERRRRRERACISYKRLEKIPQQIEEDIQKLGKRHGYARKVVDREVARLRMKQFLITWLLVLPWPARNIYECRIEGDRPNVRKYSISSENLLFPSWVAKERDIDESAEFWQFSFSAEETSSNIEVRAVLPKMLLRALETYLDKTRGFFKGQKKVGNSLFLDFFGKALSQRSLNYLINEITLKYAGVRVGAQAFRDIWAFEYLVTRPKDYFGLSLILWHRHEIITKRLYASEKEFVDSYKLNDGSRL
jgi:hypothetical protein